MDSEKIEKLRSETSQELKEATDLNKKINDYLIADDSKNDEEKSDLYFSEEEQDKEFNSLLNELDEDINDAILDFVPKEKE